jgi:hypothetical protein
MKSEKELHMKAQQWLEKSGLWKKLLIFHVPNERFGGIGTITHFKRLGVRPGVADYLLFATNHRIAIELKNEEGVQNENQKEFQEQWEAAGNRYFIARSLLQFQAIIGMLCAKV